MLRSVKYLIVFFLGFLFMTNAINAQDIEPELPDYLRTTTTTTSTTTTSTTTTEVPPEPTTKPPPTLPDTTTNLPSTNFIETTTPTTTSTIRPTVPIPTTTYPTWIPPPTTSHKPHYPHEWGNRCYYKEQRGKAYLHTFCGHFRWVYSVDCFQCCYYDFSSFAGCSKVSHQYCAHYLD